MLLLVKCGFKGNGEAIAERVSDVMTQTSLSEQTGMAGDLKFSLKRESKYS